MIADNMSRDIETTEIPPQALKVLPEGIPEELKARPQWVCWREESRGGELTKVPKIAGTSQNASSSKPETWTAFEDCIMAAKQRPRFYSGIGYVFATDDPFVGIDLDGVREPETGALSERAAEIVGRLASYAEVSPSGTGVKIWIHAALPRAHKKPGVEIYPAGRYFTTTGWILSDVPPTIEPGQGELEALILEEFPKPEPSEAERRPYNGPPTEQIDLVEFLAASGTAVLREIPDGTARRVFAVVCPWAHEHTGGDDSGTRVGQYEDGALFFHCEHAHCGGRGWGEFRSRVDPRKPVKLRTCKARRVWRRSA